MNASLVAADARPGRLEPEHRGSALRHPAFGLLTDRVELRQATPGDAEELHGLVSAHLAEGRLLPRSRDEIAAHAGRFLVALLHDRIVACADLAPLSRSVAEIRSLVVEPHVRALGIGRLIVAEVTRQAAAAGYVTLCAFTHAPAYFVRFGFSIVPHAWLPEKIQADCRSCALFRHCGQYAVALPLASAPSGCVPLASLHG
jgi:amino-acid N-acetyltransferase